MNNGPSNVPLYTVVTTAILLVAAVLLVVFVPQDKQGYSLLLGLLVTTIPSVVSSLYAERASRDIRNGVVVDKVKEGTKQAIAESQVVTRTGPVVSAELRALSRLLEANTAATETNTETLKNNEGREDNGRPNV